MKKIIIAAIAATFLAVAPAASADIVRSGNTFTAVPATARSTIGIDGYRFVNMPYYTAVKSDRSNDVNGDGWADDCAVGLWRALYADPDYQPLPPVTSVSVDTTVSGTVGDGDASAERSSWGF